MKLVFKKLFLIKNKGFTDITTIIKLLYKRLKI